MNHLGLFAKYWQPGQVKTRLAKTLGAENACALYRIFLFHLLERLQSCGDDRTVVFSPPDRAPDFKAEIQPEWEFEPQSSGDLGHRMQTFFENRLPCPAPIASSNQTNVIAIGADCPNLTASEISSAFDQLSQTDVVIGPSDDGGYYLLGMRNETAKIFENVPWSTEQVLPQTLKLLDQQNKTYTLLEPRIDVDNEIDLRQLAAELLAADRGAEDRQHDQRLLEQITAVWNKDLSA